MTMNHEIKIQHKYSILSFYFSAQLVIAILSHKQSTVRMSLDVNFHLHAGEPPQVRACVFLSGNFQ
jgi:hypothetical protein